MDPEPDGPEGGGDPSRDPRAEMAHELQEETSLVAGRDAAQMAADGVLTDSLTVAGLLRAAALLAAPEPSHTQDQGEP